MPVSPSRTIIELARIVDTLTVDDEGVRESAEIEELIPIAIVAGQPRDVETDDSAGVPEADLGHEALEARTPGSRRAGLAEIFVDHDHLAPAQAACVVLQVVLTAAALVMMTDLRERGLTDVHEGRTVQMLGADLLVTDHHAPR